jgi:photosystem II stability/assembly factor-like uncharacterized protein
MRRTLLLIVILAASLSLNAQWQPVNSPCNGKISCLLPLNQNIYAGTNDHGVYYSTDNGTTWSERNNGLGDQTVYSLASHGSKIYAGTYNGLFVSADGGASWSNVIINGYNLYYVRCVASSGQALFVGTSDSLMKSDDNGQTWRTVLITYYSAECRTIAFNGSEVWVGVTDYAIYKSTDNGENFDFIDLFDVNLSLFETFLFRGSEVLANCDGKIMESTDGGLTWYDKDNGIPYAGVTALASNGNRIYAGLMNYYLDPDYGGIYYSDNEGADWSLLGMKGDWISAIGFSGSRIIAGSNYNGTFRSEDGGVTWTDSNNGMVRIGIKSFIISGNAIYAVSSGGWIYRSADMGNNWKHVGNGIPTDQTLKSIAANGNTLFAGGYDIYRSADNGQSWSVVLSASAQVTCFAVAGSKIFAGMINGQGVFLSSDNGNTWTSSNNGLQNKNVYSLATHENTIFAGTDEGIYRSTDFGSSWAKVDNGLEYPHIPALGVSSGKIYASAFFYTYGLGDRVASVSTSMDDGAAWSVSDLAFSDNSIASAFASAPGKMIMGIDAGEFQVYMTDDDGKTWSAMNSGLPAESTVNAMAVQGNDVYISLENGDIYDPLRSQGFWKRPLSEMIPFRLASDTVFLGRDAGNTATLNISSTTPWTIEGPLPNWFTPASLSGQGTAPVVFSAMESNPWEPTRYFSTTVVSSGISRHLTVAQAGKLMGTDNITPEQAGISPNPTSGTIVVRTDGSCNRIGVYDPNGRLVLDQPVDSREIRLDLLPHGRGVYTVRLSGGNGISVKKVVVL